METIRPSALVERGEDAAHPHVQSADGAFRIVILKLMPLLFMCYVVAYLDRVNVGFAKLRMLDDLGFSDAVYGLGAGIFFIGYFFAEVPSNLILHRVGARRWIARIMITWGVISASTALVSTPLQFYILRFLLGIAEAGFFPGVVLFLTYWFPAHRRGKMVALLMAGNPVSGIVGGPVSGLIMSGMEGTKGLSGWQWLFVIEAAPAVLLGLVVFFTLKDNVQSATWLNSQQKAHILAELAEDARHKTHTDLGQSFRSARVWLLCATLFLIVMGTSTIGFWQPSIIKASGVTDPLSIGLLSSIPYIAALFGMAVMGRSADRMRERRWHTIVPVLISCPGFLLCAFYGGNTLISMIGLTLATMGIITSLPMFWALPTSFLGGVGAAAGIALINSTGNLASFVGPTILGWLKNETGTMTSGLALVTACLLLACALIALFIRAEDVNR